MPKKGKKGVKQRKIIDFAADVYFDKSRAIIYIEFSSECPIFATKADEFLQYVQESIPEQTFALVKNQYGKVVPREGAFEIGFSQNARTSVYNLWSGLDKGPPRRDKFPMDFEELMPDIRKVLKKFYAEAKPVEEDEDDEMPPPPLEEQ